MNPGNGNGQRRWSGLVVGPLAVLAISGGIAVYVEIGVQAARITRLVREVEALGDRYREEHDARIRLEEQTQCKGLLEEAARRKAP